MSEPASISAGIADRYATAIFEISENQETIPRLEEGLNQLSQALDDSADLRTLIESPLISREDQQRAMVAVAEKMGLQQLLVKSLGLMAQKRRLFVLPQLIAALRERIAVSRGEVVADVASAQPLSDTQKGELQTALSERVGKKVTLNTTVDDSLIGGLVVKVGSKMIDTSIRSRLGALQNAMKEVG